MLRQWIISGIGLCGGYVEKRSSIEAPGSPLDLQNETHFSLMFINARSSQLECITVDEDGEALKVWRH